MLVEIKYMLKDIVLFKLDVNNWMLGIIKATCVELSVLTTLSCNQSSKAVRDNMGVVAPHENLIYKTRQQAS